MQVMQDYTDFFISCSLSKDDHPIPGILVFILLFLFSSIVIEKQIQLRGTSFFILKSSGFLECTFVISVFSHSFFSFSFSVYFLSFSFRCTYFHSSNNPNMHCSLNNSSVYSSFMAYFMWPSSLKFHFKFYSPEPTKRFSPTSLSNLAFGLLFDLICKQQYIAKPLKKLSAEV